MYQRFEETLIAHCAATLAGLKVGSLFSYRLSAEDDPEGYVAHLNEELHERGVSLRLLKHCEEGCLVYVYRPSMLAETLRQRDVSAFLASCGYIPDTDALSRLASRIRCNEDFPHEIGIFLGYPLEDVVGFIKHRGQQYRCVGCWKAYSNEAEARRRFDLYRKCRRIYMKCYRSGAALARLTVAA